MNALVTTIEILMLVIVVDVLLGWVQTDPSRWPRRAFHMVTEPLLRPVRTLLRPVPSGGWDLSAPVVFAVLGLARLCARVCLS